MTRERARKALELAGAHPSAEGRLLIAWRVSCAWDHAAEDAIAENEAVIEAAQDMNAYGSEEAVAQPDVNVARPRANEAPRRSGSVRGNDAGNGHDTQQGDVPAAIRSVDPSHARNGEQEKIEE